MTITTSINTFISRAGGQIEVPKLPNELIMGIIKLADGGKTTHKCKLKPVLELIRSRKWTKENKYTGDSPKEFCYYEDYIWEQGDPPPTAQQQMLMDFWDLEEIAGHPQDDDFDIKISSDYYYIPQSNWEDGFEYYPEKWESLYKPIEKISPFTIPQRDCTPEQWIEIVSQQKRMNDEWSNMLGFN